MGSNEKTWEDLFEIMRQGDAILRRHYEAHALIIAPRKHWKYVRRYISSLQAQGMKCDVRESPGWFMRDFFVRCDDAALIALHMLGDQIALDYRK